MAYRRASTRSYRPARSVRGRGTYRAAPRRNSRFVRGGRAGGSRAQTVRLVIQQAPTVAPVSGVPVTQVAAPRRSVF